MTPGCYLVVEDTNVNGHPVYRTHGPGPMEALLDFLASGSGRLFERDRLRDHQFGYLLPLRMAASRGAGAGRVAASGARRNHEFSRIGAAAAFQSKQTRATGGNYARTQHEHPPYITYLTRTTSPPRRFSLSPTTIG